MVSMVWVVMVAGRGGDSIGFGWLWWWPTSEAYELGLDVVVVELLCGGRDAIFGRCLVFCSMLKWFN